MFFGGIYNLDNSIQGSILGCGHFGRLAFRHTYIWKWAVEGKIVTFVAEGRDNHRAPTTSKNFPDTI